MKAIPFLTTAEEEGPLAGLITIVGCGFLGSLFAEELAKRLYAFEEKRPVRLIDYDTVEERNAANQNFTRQDGQDEMYKVDVISLMLDNYGVFAETSEGDDHLRPAKLTRENYQELLDGSEIVVSALDNMEARMLVWAWGKQHKKPVIHLGISQGGSGEVTWTAPGHESWTLAPQFTVGNKKHKKNEESGEAGVQKLPPCELIAFRGLGLNTSLAGAKALGIYLGLDPEKHVPNVLPGTITVWDSTLMGHSLREVIINVGPTGRDGGGDPAPDGLWDEQAGSGSERDALPWTEGGTDG